MRRLAALALLTCASCTSVHVNRVVDNEPRSHVGAPYPLPMTTFKIELTRQVVKCGPKPEMTVQAKILGAEMRDDPLHRYVIDPDSLSTLAKTGSIKLEYDPNGVVTSFNAKIEDRTGQILANVVSMGVKLASFVAAGGDSGTGQSEGCREDVRKALAQLQPQQKKLKAATAIVEARTAELKSVQAKVAVMGDAVDDRTRARLSRAIDALTSAVEAQQDAADALGATKQALSDTRTLYWPQTGTGGPATFEYSPNDLRRFLSVSLNPADFDPGALTVYADLAPVAAITYDYGPKERVDTRLGIPFRRPVPGLLRLCKTGPCDSGGEVMAKLETPVQQFGDIYYLPCVSRPFTSVECSFTMTADGRLKSIGTSRTGTPLEGATGAAAGAIEGATNIRTTLAGRDTARLAAQTAALKAQSDYNAAVAALAPTANADVTAATAALKADTELTLAKIAKLQADAALLAALGETP